MMGKTNFDQYLQNQFEAPGFADRFKKAGDAWDVALQLAAFRREYGLSQQELAKRIGTSQQQISRMESPSYEGHSLSMLRKVAKVFGASVQVKIRRDPRLKQEAVKEKQAAYRRKPKKS